jgi:Domain of unknown function (DUF4386)
MNTISAQSTVAREATLVRLGGLAGLSVFGLYILVQFVLGFPGPSGVPPGELKTYVSEHASTAAVANGLRYLVFPCIAFLAVGMYTLTGRGATLTGNGWGILGLLGAAALMANGVIANTLLTMTYLNFANLSEQPEHFMLQRNLSRLLFSVGQLFWGLMIAGFSIAGWQSATVPRWLVIPGLLFAALGLFNAVLIAWIMTGGRAPELHLWAQTFLGSFWVLGVSILMVRRAKKN